MGLFSFFGKREADVSAISRLEIDLATFEAGRSRIGVTPSAMDFFSGDLVRTGIFRDKKGGLELGAKDGVLDSLFVKVAVFEGRFFKQGKALAIGADTAEEEIRQCFGEPYWCDESEGEVLLFYQYEAGSIELQGTSGKSGFHDASIFFQGKARIRRE